VLKDNGKALKGQRVLISGSGNVATYAAKKCIEKSAVVLTLSDRHGTYWCEDGMTEETVDQILAYKAKKGKLPGNVKIVEGARPWQANPKKKVDIALPCATQNEVEKKDVETLLKRGCHSVVEGSNLSSTAEAVEVYRKNGAKLDYVGSKLANLGGVGTSYLEMVQNSYKSHWTAEQVDEELQSMMKTAYNNSKQAATKYGVSLTDGANIAAFKKVAKVMNELGYSQL